MVEDPASAGQMHPNKETGRKLLHDRSSGAAPSTLPVRLLPQCPLLVQRETARTEELSQSLLRGRRAIDTELHQFACGLGRRPAIAPIERSRNKGSVVK
jgi:hypothetical protein